MSAQFDHLVVGIRSLAEGTGQLIRLLDVAPALGGTHPGRGTENALVSLGPGEYLEIIAPRAEARLSVGLEDPQDLIDDLDQALS